MVDETKRLAKFLSELRFGNLPGPVVRKAKNCLLDFLGVTLAGSTTVEGTIARRFVEDLHERGPCTIIGASSRMSPLIAALANGIMAHALELDDGHRFAMGHPGATSIPAALSVSELEEANGKDLIVAIVAGYEAFARLGACVNPSHTERGFHTTGTCGTFGAAAAAGKLLSLDEREMANAFGLAGTQAAGLWEFETKGTMSKPFHAGRAASSGVLAALLAEKGFTGPDTIIEGARGFCRATSDTYDLSKICDELGVDFGIMHVYFKRHAACRHFHSAIDAVLQCTENHPLSASIIKAIVVETYSMAARLSQRSAESPLAAKMSLPLSVAIATVKGKAGLNEFSEATFKSPDVESIARMISISVSPQLDREVPRTRGANVRIQFADGREVSATVKLPLGEPETPFSDRMFSEKFADLASLFLQRPSVDEIAERVSEIEHHSVKHLTDLLSQPNSL